MRLDGQIPDAAAVQPRDAAHYRKPKPRAARLRRTRLVDSVEPLEDPRRLTQRNADAVVHDRQPDALRVRAAYHRDLLRTGMAYRVLDEIGERLQHELRIARYTLRRVCAFAEPQLDAVLSGDIARKVDEIRLREVQNVALALEPRQVEYLLDKRRKPRRFLLDHRRERLADRVGRGVVQQVHRAEDSRERRPYLVRDVGHEVAAELLQPGELAYPDALPVQGEEHDRQGKQTDEPGKRDNGQVAEERQEEPEARAPHTHQEISRHGPAPMARHVAVGVVEAVAAVAPGVSGDEYLQPQALALEPFGHRVYRPVVEGAKRLCERSGSALGEVVLSGIQVVMMPGATLDRVNSAIETAGAHVAGRMSATVEYLLDIATIAPLVGLLGTVLGMFKAFSGVANNIASAKTVILAQGVSQAIITTVFGLAVSIPVLAAYAFFRRRVARRTDELESAADEVVDAMVSREK